MEEPLSQEKNSSGRTPTWKDLAGPFGIGFCAGVIQSLGDPFCIPRASKSSRKSNKSVRADSLDEIQKRTINYGQISSYAACMSAYIHVIFEYSDPNITGLYYGIIAINIASGIGQTIYKIHKTAKKRKGLENTMEYEEER